MIKPAIVVVVLAAALGCGGGDGGDDTGSQTDPLVVSATQTAAVAMALGAPLKTDGELLHMDLTPDTAEAHTRAESGFSGNSVVTPPSCATFNWSATMSLTAGITMTGCTLEATGTPISGSITFTVAFTPTKFTLAFTGLSVNTTTYDGSVSLTVTGGTDMGTMRSTTLDADLMTTTAAGTNHLVLTGTVAAATGGFTLNGPGSITIPAPAGALPGRPDAGPLTAALTMTDLFFATGNCLPTRGSVVVTVAPFPAVTYTFLSTTPMDGMVTKTPPGKMVTLVPPCGSRPGLDAGP